MWSPAQCLWHWAGHARLFLVPQRLIDWSGTRMAHGSRRLRFVDGLPEGDAGSRGVILMPAGVAVVYSTVVPTVISADMMMALAARRQQQRLNGEAS
ncbi:MAG: hypothetical protein VX589_16670 [Myxococcota bacterium]|nr:hypothetical protein [Myxococcota bacterium]